MKILLVGEYSNVHWTLAEGLRLLGHEVKVLSNGDFWKNYPRDYSLVRESGRWSGVKYMFDLLRLLPKMRGYDVVQLINPMFLELTAERLFSVYRYLRRNNKKVILGAYGMDYYWVKTGSSTQSPFRYGDFNIGHELRTNVEAESERKDWLGTAKEHLNKLIATDSDAIVAGLYEYWRCYEPVFPQKTVFIPFPIDCEKDKRPIQYYTPDRKVRIFVGISKSRSAYKGTDIMLSAAQDLHDKYADRVELKVAEGIPFAAYCEMMEKSDVILDQLYSYTPAMNALQAMSRGIICVGGGELENYDILNETELRPIINVTPSYESVYHQLEALIMHPERIADLQSQSVAYVKRHHDYIKVAQQYEALYSTNR